MEQPPGKHMLTASLLARYGPGTKGCGWTHSGLRTGQDASAEHVCSMPSSPPTGWGWVPLSPQYVMEAWDKRSQSPWVTAWKTATLHWGPWTHSSRRERFHAEPLRLQSLFVRAANTLLMQTAGMHNIITNSMHLKGTRWGGNAVHLLLAFSF